MAEAIRSAGGAFGGAAAEGGRSTGIKGGKVMREADVPGHSQRTAYWRALSVRAMASAILLCGATRVEAQFKVPAIPGWTDTSPGVTLGPLPALSPQQLTALRGDSIVASGIDLRDPSAVFRPNFTVLVIAGAMRHSRGCARTRGFAWARTKGSLAIGAGRDQSRAAQVSDRL